ncbi:glycosyltransferase family 2 protein [Lacibacterium aquatile]|uniref:Glycosyltransferase family 2 protein n=1 Tax=Lacibacterium aquatile TaxID=1168082 RepID=A0ABW5DXE1_9PROT
MSLSVIILTFNAEATIAATLASAALVSDDIHVVDSGSTDGTLALIAASGATLHQHPFENYGAQRNWAIETLPLKHGWQLHLDADERLSDDLARQIKALRDAGFPGPIVGYHLPRLVRFMGRELKHGGFYPTWHMRLFKTGQGRCENRKYDQHFLCDGPTTQIHAPMIDDLRMSLTEWTARHNRWSDAEADEIEQASHAEGLVKPDMSGDPIQKKRALRGWYNKAPLFLRALLLFLYRYVARLGFLDGTPGLIYCVLQTFWFRFLVDAKLYERRAARGDRS